MVTNQTTIYNGNLTANQENLTATFTNGIGFYLIAPNNINDLEIDIFLQIDLSNTVTRQIRLQPFNVSNTQRVTLLPTEITELNLPLRLAILPSNNFNLQIILLQTDCRICNIKSELDLIKATLNQILANQGVQPENNNSPTPQQQQFFFIN